MHLPIRQVRALAGTLVITAGLGLGAIALPASASAAQARASGGTAHAVGKYCASWPAPLKRGQSSSRVMRYCSNRNDKATGLPAGFRVPEANVLMVTFYANPDYATGPYYEFFGPGCAGGGQKSFSDTNVGFGFKSWKASNSCWATTLYYGENFTGAKYQYAQGTYEAAQIGSPWNGHVWSVWTGYSR